MSGFLASIGLQLIVSASKTHAQQFKCHAEPHFPSTVNPFVATDFTFDNYSDSNWRLIGRRSNMGMPEQVGFVINEALQDGTYNLLNHPHIRALCVIGGQMGITATEGEAKVSWDKKQGLIDIDFKFTTDREPKYKIEGKAHIHKTS